MSLPSWPAQAVTQQQLPAGALLAAGMLSSTTAQLVSYPLGLVRTRLQVSRKLITLQSHLTSSEMRSWCPTRCASCAPAPRFVISTQQTLFYRID